MNRTPVLDQHQIDQLAFTTFHLFQNLFVPKMGVSSIYGIALPASVPFDASDADAMMPNSFTVADPYERFGAPPFPRLPLADDIDIVITTINAPTHDVLSALTLPAHAIGLVVASQAHFTGVLPDPTLPPIADIGYFVTASAPEHTTALAGIPGRKVFGTIDADHPDVQAVIAVVNKTCCRVS